MVDVYKLVTQTSLMDLLRQSHGAPSDAALYAAMMSSIDNSDRSFGRLVASCDKEMRPVVSPIHGYVNATMQSLGPLRSMDPGASERRETRLAIKVKPWELLATEAVMEERQWKAMLLALKNALGPERLVAAVAIIEKSEEVKQEIGPQRFKKAVSLLSGPGDDPWACVPG